MIRRSIDRVLLTMLEYVGFMCDECGTHIDTSTAKVVTDATGTFPVCAKCAARWFN